MSYDKTILCLANSRRPGGRCVAGKEKINNQFGGWVRPVSNRPTEEISQKEGRYKDGSDPDVLDIIVIPMIQPKPTGFQSENHLIDPEYYWEKAGQATWSQVLAAVDAPSGSLWINGSSSYNGSNDRVIAASANTLKNSLFLIKPSDLKIVVATEGEDFGNPRRRVRASFHFNGEYYIFSVTDPFYRDQYLEGENGSFPIRTGLLCVSLGGLHEDGYAYKLAAAIITPERAR